MQGSGAGTPSSVQVEWLALFPQSENRMQIPMGKEHAAFDEVVGGLPRDFLEACDKLLIDFAGAKTFCNVSSFWD